MLEWFFSSGIMILIVMALRRLLKGRIGLRLQYGLWALVLLRLLIPISLPASQISVQNIAAKAPVEQVTEIYIPRQSFADAYDEVLRDYESRGVSPAAIKQSVLDSAATERMRSHITLGQILTGIWIMGAVAVLAFTAWCNHRFRAKLRADRWKIDVPWISLPVYVSDSLDTPCIFGVFRPTIYLTPDIAGDETRMRHILEHEMTHYFHGDHVFAPLRCLALALHWFDPLAWWAVRASRQDGELACDEGTIRRIGEKERLEYGRTLIRLTCDHVRPVDMMLTATTMSDDKNTIKERIIMIAKKPHTAIYTLIAVFLVAAIAVGCTFTGAVDDTQPTQTTGDRQVSLTLPQQNKLPQTVLDQIGQQLRGELEEANPGVSIMANVTDVIHGGECRNHYVYRVQYDLILGESMLSRQTLAVFRGSPYAAAPEDQWVLVDHLSDDRDAGETAAEYWRQWYLSEQTDPRSLSAVPAGGETTDQIPRDHRLDDDRMFALHEALWDRLSLVSPEGEAGAVILDLIPMETGGDLPNVYLYQMEYTLVLDRKAWSVTEYPIFVYTPGGETDWTLAAILNRDDLECFRAESYTSRYGNEYAAAAALCVPGDLGDESADLVAHTNAVVDAILTEMTRQEGTVTWTGDPEPHPAPRSAMSFAGQLSSGFDWMPADQAGGSGGEELALTAGNHTLVFRSDSDIVEYSDGTQTLFYRAIGKELVSVYETALRVYDMARFLEKPGFEAESAQEAAENFLENVLPARHLDTRPGSWYQALEVKVLESSWEESVPGSVTVFVRYALRQEALSLEGYGNVREGEGEYAGWLILDTSFILEHVEADLWRQVD